MRTSYDVQEAENARRYVDRCEDRVTAAMHCDDAEFRAANEELRRAKIRLFNLEKAQ